MDGLTLLDQCISNLVKRKAVDFTILKEELCEKFDCPSLPFDQPEVDSGYAEFKEWLDNNFSIKPLTEDIVALNFGLFESEDGVELYICGSSEWDEEDSDWACNNDYSPEGRYADLAIFQMVEPFFADNYWAGLSLYLGLTVLYVRKYAVDEGFPFEEARGQLYLATGFDDGDLYNIGLVTGNGFELL